MDSRTSRHRPILPSTPPPAACGSIRTRRASTRTPTRPMPGCTARARPSSGRSSASGASAVSTTSTGCCATAASAGRSPVGIPDSRGVDSDRSHLDELRRRRGELDAGARAAGPHAAAHAGQPRLRLAAGRAAAAARRGAGERADRSPFRPAKRSTCCRPSPRRCRSPSSPKCSACRSRWGRNCSTGRTRWSRCTCMAARARRRRRPTARRRNSPISCAATSPSGRKKPGDDLLSLLISAQEDGQKLSEDELVSSAILLLNAGHEATVHQTGNAVRAILAQGGDPRRFFASRGSDRGNGRGMPALRRAAAYVHALCL